LLAEAENINSDIYITINKIIHKIFGAMSKDLYIEISAHFGIESVEKMIADRRNRFINRYGETDNYLFIIIIIIYVKSCADWFICLTVFLLIAFV